MNSSRRCRRLRPAHVGRCTIVVAWCAAAATAGTFEPFTEEGGPRGLTFQMLDYPQAYGYLGFGCGYADLDGDGDQDIVAIGAADTHIGIFENDGTGHFIDRSANSGIPLVPQGSAFAAADYDGDGDLDLYITQLGLPNLLLRNAGGFTFTDVAGPAQVDDDGAGKGACWGDFDGDGWVDLYVCNYNGIVPGTADIDNKLYRNLGNGTFQDVSVEQTVDDFGYSFQAVWFDYDRDGDVDLYLSNDRGHLPPFNRSNQLWRNDEGQMVNVSVGSGADLGLFSMGLACGDFDGNRWPDMYVTNIDGYEDGFNPLFLNQGDGTFIESSELAGVDQYITSWGAIFFDFDNDADLELYVNNMFQDNTFFTQTQGFPCVEIAAQVDLVGTTFDDSSSGVSFAAAVADIDADGDLDVLENNLGDLLQLYVNNEGTNKRFIRYRLVGEWPNVHAVGGLVDTRVGPQWQMREVLAGGNGYLGQNELTLHVGVGEALTVDEVTVHWPGGAITRTLTNLPTNFTWPLYPPSQLGDADGDGVRDLGDFEALAECFGQPFEPACAIMDLDGNGSIEILDAETLLEQFADPVFDCDGNGIADLIDVLVGAIDDNGNWIPDACETAGDLNGDGVVNVSDLIQLIQGWGPCTKPPAGCPGDTDGSGEVDVNDLITLLVNWSS